jgi:hypothetical protein
MEGDIRRHRLSLFIPTSPIQSGHSRERSKRRPEGGGASSLSGADEGGVPTEETLDQRSEMRLIRLPRR